MNEEKADDSLVLQERVTIDEAVLAISTFYNGCDFRLVMDEGKPFLEYGCYGVHPVLTQGKRRCLMHWLGVDGNIKPKPLPIKPETLVELLNREPCKRCGGTVFKQQLIT